MIHFLTFTKIIFISKAIIVLGAQVTECAPGQSLRFIEVEKIIRDMNQQELDDFIRVLNEYEMENHNNQVIEESNNKWKTIALFAVSSMALFIILQYGTTIFQTLSQVGRDIGNASLNTLLEMSSLATPEYAIKLPRALLEDPRSVQKVYRALDSVVGLHANV